MTGIIPVTGTFYLFVKLKIFVMKYKLSLNNFPCWRFLMMVIVSFYTSISIAQTLVKGNIKDVSGEPLIGVSIKEKGTSNGTVSDLDGNFAITTSVRDKK